METLTIFILNQRVYIEIVLKIDVPQIGITLINN